MSEFNLISPMLDGFAMGDSISEHNGVYCCPAMETESGNKYIVKIISVPASETQLDALLLTGAYPDKDSALAYFREVTQDVLDEIGVLQKLSQLEGFLPYEKHQSVTMESGNGYHVYLLGVYKRSLERHLSRTPMTHLGAVNLGLDLCAALTVCRRSGYLYVDLKPTNIFVTSENEYRIGDLGFISLTSLKYASLPDKYRSKYTAPEIQDAFSSLNTTVDIYALGLILYQAYNNGALPFTGDRAPAEAFPAPAYADYEMAEIILKACAPDPADRWRDPIEMGQALVSYMQRNGANDVPIVPIIPVTEIPDPVGNDDSNTSANDEPELDSASSTEDIADFSTEPEETTFDPADTEAEPDSSMPDDLPQTVFAEDELGNLSFLNDISDDETAPEHAPDQIAYDEVSDEVSDILSLADDLVSHPVPAPVVAPDPIEVPMPEPIAVEEDSTPEESDAAASDKEATDVTMAEEETAAPAEETEQEDSVSVPVKKKSVGRWIWSSVIILLILGLLAGGYYYFTNYYLQHVDSLTADGSKDSLVVHVDSAIDEGLLKVVCTDAYGSQFFAPVVDGKATFTSLVPNTGYTVSVQIDGFHKLTGQYTTNYTTPAQTGIVQFNAVTGSEDGSVIVSFTVEGPDAEKWIVGYSASGEEEKFAEITGHMITLTGLSIGKEYTFTLKPNTELYVTGDLQYKYTASKVIYAQDLTINSCMNNALTVTWAAPEGVSVENWTVRCYNDNGYNETLVTPALSATFTGLNHNDSFTVEVTAAQMTTSQRIFLPKNSVSVTDFKAELADNTELHLSWNSSLPVADENWVLQYTVEGLTETQTATCKENTAVITPVFPGAAYQFSLQTADGTAVLSGNLDYTAPEAEKFSRVYNDITITSDDFTFSMCRHPGWNNWDWFNIKTKDYTTEFPAGDKACYVVKIAKDYDTNEDPIDLLYVVTDEAGQIVEYTVETIPWRKMWYQSHCELDIPCMPMRTGKYTMTIYFNGQFAGQNEFTIVP